MVDPNSSIVNFPVNSRWRYYIERITTNTWLDRDLRLTNVEITWELSGPGSLTATVDAELAKAIGIDGILLLDEWSTAIYAEADGEIRWGGILHRSDASDNGSRELEFVGFAAYPKGRIYDGAYEVFEMDPFNIIRMLWDFVQSDPHGNLNMHVDQTPSPVTIGGADPGPRPVQQAGESDADYQDRVFQWEADHGDGAYSLNWWDHPDVGDEIDNLFQQTPADYQEHHVWTDHNTKDEVFHRLELGYPLIGRRRLDLRFTEGENIAVPPMPSRDGDEYANHVTALGAGSGRDMLRVYAGGVDGRLRRDKVIEEKAVTSLDRLRSFAQTQYNINKNITYLDEITVFNHPNAQIGSWSVGDEIHIQAYSAFEQIDDWFRITSWTFNPDDNDTATIEIVRSTT